MIGKMMDTDSTVTADASSSPEATTAVSQEAPAASQETPPADSAASKDIPLQDTATTATKPELSSQGKIELAALKVLAHFGGSDQARQQLVEHAEKDARFKETIDCWDAFQAGKLSEFLARPVS